MNSKSAWPAAILDRAPTSGLETAIAGSPRRKLWSLADWLIGAWILGMIGVPVLLWIGGEAVLPWTISINVLLLAGAMVLILYRAWGLSKTLETFALVFVLAWLLEYIGSTTGFPFGVYEYTTRFQPQLGHVPLIIPLAWLMMLPPAWAVGQAIAPHSRVGSLLVAAAAFTAWDLFLDPQMVAWGMWEWAADGGYFGVPWQNFAGWFLGALLLSVVVRPLPLWPHHFGPHYLGIARAFFRPMSGPLLVYGVTWFLQTVGLWLFWGMPGPALVGAVIMGTFFWLAVWRSIHQ